MKKGLALFLCLVLMGSMIVIPIPSEALRYGTGTDLSTVDASFIGENANDFAGTRVAGAGDVNGDDYGDILISGHRNDDGGSDAGQVYLILGSSTGWAQGIDLSTSNASFIGENSDDTAGLALGGGGDVNGDGYDDFLIGAYRNDDGGSDAGKTYLIFGRASGWSMDTLLLNANASFIGESSDDRSGGSVAIAGDVNGDGFDDILIGGSGNDDGGTEAGKIHLIFGKSSGWIKNSSLSQTDGSFIGEAANDMVVGASGAGDVNDDGFDDIVLGATRNDAGGSDAGQAYLIFGKNSGWLNNQSLAQANASFIGENANDRAGVVAGVGDMNRDGFDDIAIAAQLNDEGGSNAGQIYIIFGGASGWSMDRDLSNADASYIGQAADNRAGWSISGAGDVNGDGFDDIVIGGPWYNGWRGIAHLALGKASGWSMDFNLGSADASFGVVAGCTGEGVSGKVDVNRDGYDDIIIGSAYTDGGGANSGAAYLIFPEFNSPPISVASVKAYSDSSFLNEITTANVNSIVYIELQGTDGDPADKNVALLKVTSEATPKSFLLKLLETGLNTGTYRGNFTIKNRTHDNYRWINATVGGMIVKATWLKDPAKNATLTVTSPLVLNPTNDDLFVEEDAPYQNHYWPSGWKDDITVNWVFDTNATWLDWNDTTHNISGIPDNSGVGTYWVRINVSNSYGFSDEHNFTLVVNNTPPEINTSDVLGAVEDTGYGVDYNSTDDDQGTITWHLDTDAGAWLTIDPVTGVLSGTPANDDVGQHDVNVSVDDGNGGWAWSNFTLNVTNTNDAPIINTTVNDTTYEDALYSVQFEVDDADLGDTHTWGIVTDAGDWLSLVQESGFLSGTPLNDDVGIYWVNVSVEDLFQAIDFLNFTLTVNNTNDLPEITSTPVTQAMAYLTYRYNVTATDVDVGDSLTFSLDTYPDGMTMDSVVGLVEWSPTEVHDGLHPVVVRVSDGTGSVTQMFNISVTVPETIPPKVTLLAPAQEAETNVTKPIFTWEVEDPDSTVVRYDVYLSSVKEEVMFKNPTAKVAEKITQEFFIPASELIKGTTYYWTVIPDDGDNIGECLSGIWKFKVAAEAKVNNPPVIITQPILKATVGEEYRYDVNATDDDVGDVLSFSLTEKPDGMVIDHQTGLIIWTPSDTQEGDFNVNIKVSDGKVFVVQSFIVNVTKAPVINNKPVITAIVDQTIKIGDALTYQVAASDADAGDVLTYSLEDQPTGMEITSTGLITWSPQKSQVGEHTITVNVSDGKDDITAQFTVTVDKDKKEPTTDGLGSMFPILIAVIIVIVVVVLVLAMTRRGKTPEEHLEEEEPEEPPEEYPDEKKEEPVEAKEEVEDEPEEEDAELEDEIDLDDLEEED